MDIMQQKNLTSDLYHIICKKGQVKTIVMLRIILSIRVIICGYNMAWPPRGPPWGFKVEANSQY